MSDPRRLTGSILTGRIRIQVDGIPPFAVVMAAPVLNVIDPDNLHWMVCGSDGENAITLSATANSVTDQEVPHTLKAIFLGRAVPREIVKALHAARPGA